MQLYNPNKLSLIRIEICSSIEAIFLSNKMVFLSNLTLPCISSDEVDSLLDSLETCFNEDRGCRIDGDPDPP